MQCSNNCQLNFYESLWANFTYVSPCVIGSCLGPQRKGGPKAQNLGPQLLIQTFKNTMHLLLTITLPSRETLHQSQVWINVLGTWGCLVLHINAVFFGKALLYSCTIQGGQSTKRWSLLRLAYLIFHIKLYMRWKFHIIIGFLSKLMTLENFVGAM